MFLSAGVCTFKAIVCLNLCCAWMNPKTASSWRFVTPWRAVTAIHPHYGCTGSNAYIEVCIFYIFYCILCMDSSPWINKGLNECFQSAVTTPHREVAVTKHVLVGYQPLKPTAEAAVQLWAEHRLCDWRSARSGSCCVGVSSEGRRRAACSS